MVWMFAAAIVVGLLVLVWSADRFVDGAAITARRLGMSPLLIGMLVVGFGTSAPEMVVSVLAASQGNPGVALGNAYGSNIANLGLILGLTAVLSPVAVRSTILRKELPVLTLLTALAAWQAWDARISRGEASLLLLAFIGLMVWAVWQGRRAGDDSLGEEMDAELRGNDTALPAAVGRMVLGLALLIASSRLLVWGAVGVAQAWGVSDLMIGLTVVAIGTSLPELAAAMVAVRKGEHDMALGNVLGSNLFNTLAVVGLAGVISPMAVEPDLLSRDVLVMAALTLALFVMGYGFRQRPGRINRFEGGVLVCAYAGYMAWLISA